MLVLEELVHSKTDLREVVSAGEPLNPEIITMWSERGDSPFAKVTDKPKPPL